MIESNNKWIKGDKFTQSHGDGLLIKATKQTKKRKKLAKEWMNDL